MVGQRTLDPFIMVRIHVPQPRLGRFKMANNLINQAVEKGINDENI